MNYFQREQYCGVSTQGLYHLPALPSSQGFSAWSGEYFYHLKNKTKNINVERKKQIGQLVETNTVLKRA